MTTEGRTSLALPAPRPPVDELDHDCPRICPPTPAWGAGGGAGGVGEWSGIRGNVRGSLEAQHQEDWQPSPRLQTSSGGPDPEDRDRTSGWEPSGWAWVRLRQPEQAPGSMIAWGGAQGVGATYLFQQVLVCSDEQLLLFNPFGILRKSTKYVHTH